MKKFLVILILLISIPAIYARVSEIKDETLKTGTFKKKHNGEIVQYDKNGKKIGVYKMKYGKIVRVK